MNRLFSSGSPINDRRVFFEISFPKWSGFYVDSFDENIQPVEALQNLACLVEGTSSVWTSTSKYPYRHAVDHTKLRLSEVGGVLYLPNLQEINESNFKQFVLCCTFIRLRYTLKKDSLDFDQILRHFWAVLYR